MPLFATFHRHRRSPMTPRPDFVHRRCFRMYSDWGYRLYVLEQQLRPLAVRHGHDIDVWLHCRVRLRHTPTILHCIQKLILNYSKVVVIVKSFIIFVAHREALISVNLLQLDTWVRPWDHGYSATASCGVDCLLCTYCWMLMLVVTTHGGMARLSLLLCGWLHTDALNVCCYIVHYCARLFTLYGNFICNAQSGYSST